MAASAPLRNDDTTRHAPSPSRRSPRRGAVRGHGRRGRHLQDRADGGAGLPEAWQLALAWVLGGVLSFVGALCFAGVGGGLSGCGWRLPLPAPRLWRPGGFSVRVVALRGHPHGFDGPAGFVFGDYLATVVDLSPWHARQQRAGSGPDRGAWPCNCWVCAWGWALSLA